MILRKWLGFEATATRGRGSELLNTGQGIGGVMPDASDFQLLSPTRPSRGGAPGPGTTARASAAGIPIAPPPANATPETSPSAPAPASTLTSDGSPARPATPAAPSARARRCATPTSRSRRPAPCSSTSPRAAASDRPDVGSTSTATRSPAWRNWPGTTPTTLRTGAWLVPPRTSAVEVDELGAFVGQKQPDCAPAHPADGHRGGGVGPRRV